MMRGMLFCGAVMSAASALFCVGAQQSEAQGGKSFTAEQCDDAKRLALTVMRRYPTMSSALAGSFRSFAEKCDPGTLFIRDTDVDEQAFGEFRVKLVALRTCWEDPKRKGCE